MMVCPSTVTISEDATGGPGTRVLFLIKAPPAVLIKACGTLLLRIHESLRDLHSVRNPNLQSAAALDDPSPFANDPIHLVPRNMLKNMAGINEIKTVVGKREALRCISNVVNTAAGDHIQRLEPWYFFLPWSNLKTSRVLVRIPPLVDGIERNPMDGRS